MRSPALLFALAVPLASSAEVIAWTNASTGNWNNPLNWSPNQVPGPSDTAVVTNLDLGGGPVTVRLDGNAAAGGLILGAPSGCGGGQVLRMNGQALWLYGPLTVGTCGQFYVDKGTLVGAAEAVVHGKVSWNGGSLSGSLAIANDGVVEVTGTDQSLPDCVLTNFGTVTWANGDLHGGGASPATLIYNYGLWDAQGDHTFDNLYGANGTHFFNLGTVLKSAGLGTNAFRSVGLENHGNLEVKTGALSLQGGGSLLGGSTAGDGLIQLAAGSFNVNGTMTSTNTQLLGGGLGGINLLQGGFSWLGGTWNNCQVTIAGDCLVRIEGERNDLANCLVTNLGTVMWVSGTLRGGGAAPGGTRVYNYGLWEADSDQVFNNDYLANGTSFYNGGVFRKVAGQEALVLEGVHFVTSGVVDIQSGALSLSGGGSFGGGSTAGGGLIQLSDGYFNFNGTVASTNVQLVGGSLSGENWLEGGFTWVNGQWAGVSVTIATNCLVNIVGAGNHDLPGCALTNYGTLSWASGTLRGGGASPGGTIVQNYGLWEVHGDNTFNNAYGANGTHVINSGVLSKGVGSSTNNTLFAPGVGLQSSGVVEVREGTLTLQGGGMFDDGSIGEGVGLLQLDTGWFTLQGAFTSTNVQLTGGNLVGINEVRGSITWISGSLAGSIVTVFSNSLFRVAAGSSNHDLPNCILTNYGTVAWEGGNLRGGSSGPNTSVFNFGLWDAQCDRTISAVYGANGVYFLNFGTFRKSAGTNDTSVAAGVTFENRGLLDAQVGNIGFAGACVLDPCGSIRFGLSGPADFGHLDITGTALLAGTVSVNLRGGYEPVVGSSFAVLGYDSRSGIFADALLPSACVWQTNYATRAFALNVLNAQPVLSALPVQTVDELTTLRVTNQVMHPDAPAQTVRFGLDTGPAGMTVDPKLGIVTWTPGQLDALTTNVVRVWVLDDGTPPLGDTNTFPVVVREVNMPPQLGEIRPQTVDELTVLTVTNRAEEPDIHAVTAGYALIIAPGGMEISASGIITWTPTQLQSPSTNTVVTVVTNTDPFDPINPHLGATNSFLVIVREVNVSPVLPKVPDQTAYELMPLKVVNTASEANIHSVLGYRLINPPTGMTIDAAGVITWTPTHSQSPSTNVITTVVTNTNPYDLVNPHLSATNAFVVVVKERCLLTGACWLPDGTFQFTLETAAGGRYTLEYSTTLQDWESVLSFTSPGGVLAIIDPNAGEHPHCFYRVRMEP